MAAMTMLSRRSRENRRQRGARIPLLIAGLALTGSSLMLVRLSATTPFTWLFTAYVIFGIGFGFVNAPITNAAVSGMPRAQRSRGSNRQHFATDRFDLGVAVAELRLCVLAKEQPLDFAFASRAGWWVLAGCGVAVLILGMVATTRGPGPRHTARPRPSTPSIWRSTSYDEDGDRRERAAREAWRAMADLVLDNERRREVGDQVGMSFGKIRALRRTAKRPMPIASWPPYSWSIHPTTQVGRRPRAAGLVERRAHPTDRRVKLGVATTEGTALARQADEIWRVPPPAHRPPPRRAREPGADLAKLHADPTPDF